MLVKDYLGFENLMPLYKVIYLHSYLKLNYICVCKCTMGEGLKKLASKS